MNWQPEMLRGQTAVITGVSRKIGIGVAIARALAHDPLLVLADEPTGNLDEETGEVVLQLLLSLTRNAGKTLIMATHSPEVVPLADHVYHIHEGKLIAEPEPAATHTNGHNRRWSVTR